MIPGDIATHKVHKFVGKCIYCGSTENLHDEHCIPESLNGVRLLDKGSCRNCGNITSAFEGRYARESMLAARTALNMKSKRSKKKRPTEFPMRLIKDGQERVINVPVSDHISLIPMLEVGPPRYCPHPPHKKGLQPGQYELFPFKVKEDEEIDQLLIKYNADSISVDCNLEIIGFLRIIAKIAYCTVIWKYGLHNIGKAYVVPAILGQGEICDWVGSHGDQRMYEESKHMNTDHIVTTWQTEDGELHAGVKLFKKSHTPEYHVVVGRLTEGVQGLYQSIGYK
ncbi:MAG: HNH endonuclease [Acidobacteriota bacterium]|nr:HNH endonuclease [Acidobacteriota bacterium]